LNIAYPAGVSNNTNILVCAAQGGNFYFHVFIAACAMSFDLVNWPARGEFVWAWQPYGGIQKADFRKYDDRLP